MGRWYPRIFTQFQIQLPIQLSQLLQILIKKLFCNFCFFSILLRCEKSKEFAMAPTKRNGSVIVFDPVTQTLSTEKLEHLGSSQSVLPSSD